MAEAAQAQASAAISPQRDIKQEPNGLDFDFSMAPTNGDSKHPPTEFPQPEPTTEVVTNSTPTYTPPTIPDVPPGSPTKRTIENVEATIESPEAKRMKAEPVEQNDAPMPPERPQPEPQTQPQEQPQEQIEAAPALQLPRSQAQGPSEEQPPNQQVEPHAQSEPLEEGDFDEAAMDALVQSALNNINDIMDQYPEDDEQGDANGVNVANEVKGPISFIDEPAKFMQNHMLNALGNSAVAILLLLSQRPHNDVIAKLRDPESEHARQHTQLRQSYEALKLTYSDQTILSASDYEIQSDIAGTIIQFVNLAQLGGWLYDGSPEAMCEADKNLPRVFRDERLGLAGDIVNLMMGIKTQRTINLVQSKDDKRLSEDELKQIFFEGAEKELEEHGITNLVHGTEKTITDCLSERVDELRNLTAETNVAEKYSTAELLRMFCEYSNNQLALAEQLSERLGFTRPKYEEPVVDDQSSAEDLLDFASLFQTQTEDLIRQQLANLEEDLPPPEATVTNGEIANNGTAQPTAKGASQSYYKVFEALVDASTDDYIRTTLNVLSPTPYQPTIPPSTTESMAAQVQHANHLNSTQRQAQNSYYPTYPQATTEQQQQPQQQPPQTQQPHQQQSQVSEQQTLETPSHGLPPTQTCSSAELYEKARQAAINRNSAHTRREGLHSTRRPWTSDEERALMQGLDMVKGPHWSQILGLFGHQGSLSDILRERTQVQLKDKARNLKLFFLKTNSEMPYYLNSVTGELKTRAPTQAARKEAEERARQDSVEDQAKVQNLMPMTNGLQQSPQHRNHAGGVMTPVHAAAVARQGPNHTPTQSPQHRAVYPNPVQGGTPTTPATPSQQPRQGYGSQPGISGAQAHIQPQLPRLQPQTQAPTTNGSHGSPNGHYSDQPVKEDPHHQAAEIDAQRLVEQLRMATQDTAPAPQNSVSDQRFPSPTTQTEQTAPAERQTAVSSATTVATPTQSQHTHQSPAPAQATPSGSSTPAAPAPQAPQAATSALPVEAPALPAVPEQTVSAESAQSTPTVPEQSAPEQAAPAVLEHPISAEEEANNGPQDEMETTDFNTAELEATLLKDLSALIAP